MAGSSATLDVERMLDYREQGDYIRGFTRFVARVSDVAQYVVPVSDFGRGVSMFSFELPAGMTVDRLAEKFEEFVKQSPVFVRIDRDVIRQREFAVQSLIRLADDGYVGIYECGAASKNRYMLVVQSYDACAAEEFQQVMMERIKKYVDKATTQKARAAKFNAFSPADKTLLDKHNLYANMIKRSSINRRHIAACFFAAVGIKVNTEMCAAPDREEKLVAVDRTSLTHEYLCTFLDREGTYMRIYNWAYKVTDMLNGAPWHNSLHEGLRIYHGSQRVVADIKTSHMSGAPMGAPYVERLPTATLANSDAVKRVVVWSTPDLSTMLVADPALRVPSQLAVASFEQKFHMDAMRVDLWRTIRVAVTTPDPHTISLRDRVVYGLTETVTVPFEAYTDIMCMWSALTAFQRNRERIAHGLPRAQETMPADYVLPSVRDLFAGENVEEGETQMERAILSKMYVAYPAVVQFARKFMPTIEDEMNAPRVHDVILTGAANIVVPITNGKIPNTHYQSGDDPIGASDIDTATDASDTELHILEATAAARMKRMKPPARVVVRPQQQPQPPMDDDFYVELGVGSELRSEDDAVR